MFFVKGAPRIAVDGTPRRAVKAFDNENPTGAWNADPRQPTPEGGVAPLRKGRLQIQSEGAEVFYRNIAVRPITEFPKEYRP